MKKLTEENIRFIDRYLDNSDVVYADIRTEMVDHVASEIEERIKKGDTRDFYFIFKDFMLEHKARLLGSNRKFIKLADKKIAKAIFKDLASVKGILSFTVLCILFYVGYNVLDYKTFKSILYVVPLVMLLFFGLIYWIALKRLKLNRFSAVERIGFTFMVIFQVFTFVFNITRSGLDQSNVLYLILIMGLFSVLTLSLFKVTFSMAKFYKKRFKNFNVS
ncbi:hypothetical protein [uncultured Winogradskyella sp.]|uniref:hypothetical protein n=1 Tax=uncultured Winogradskyella sp. TaxID=395353 RepID=UPI003511069B